MMNHNPSSVQFSGGPNIAARRLTQVVNGLGCEKIRQCGSHMQFVTESGVRFGFPDNNKTISPGVFGEVAGALGVSKKELLTWCQNDRAFKQAKKQRLNVMA